MVNFMLANDRRVIFAPDFKGIVQSHFPQQWIAEIPPLEFICSVISDNIKSTSSG